MTREEKRDLFFFSSRRRHTRLQGDWSSDVCSSDLRERKVYEAQVAEQKKPEHIRGKIVEGMIKKFYEDNVLLEQKFVRDDKRTVGDLVKELSAKTGEKIDVRRFARLKVGEG